MSQSMSQKIEFDLEMLKKAVTKRGMSLREMAFAVGHSGSYFSSNYAKGSGMSKSTAKMLEVMYSITPAEYQIPEEPKEEPKAEPIMDMNELYKTVYSAVYNAMKQAWRDS